MAGAIDLHTHSSVSDGTEPPADLNATADYKRHVARVRTNRALTTAAEG